MLIVAGHFFLINKSLHQSWPCCIVLFFYSQVISLHENGAHQLSPWTQLFTLFEPHLRKDSNSIIWPKSPLRIVNSNFHGKKNPKSGAPSLGLSSSPVISKYVQFLTATSRFYTLPLTSKNNYENYWNIKLLGFRQIPFPLSIENGIYPRTLEHTYCFFCCCGTFFSSFSKKWKKRKIADISLPALLLSSGRYTHNLDPKKVYELGAILNSTSAPSTITDRIERSRISRSLKIRFFIERQQQCVRIRIDETSQTDVRNIDNVS